MRKVCVFTGSRAEYGLLRPLLEEIEADGDLALQLVVSGSHLSSDFGSTYQHIEADGYKIAERIEVLMNSDSQVGVCKSMGLGLISYAEALDRLKPDCLVVLGDRYETFAMASAAHVLSVPILHLHGGETTQGAIDEAFRHAITKMAALHFTSTEEYRRRVIQLGEQPDRVFNVGAIGIENIRKLNLLSKERLEEEISFALGEQALLVTFHPVTLEPGTSQQHVQILLAAIDAFPQAHIIFTKANADSDHGAINRILDEYVAAHRDRAIVFASMGQLAYLSALKHTDVVLGNSSSGIIEAPSFKVPSINIGNRQKGRVKAASVIDCDPTTDSITEALTKALDPAFRATLQNVTNPYEKDGTAFHIKRTIAMCDLNAIRKKAFFDL